MRLFVASLIFVSASAVACPNLAGNYPVCRSTTGNTSGATDTVITQRSEGGITTYTISSTENESQERTTESVIADGVTRTTTDTSEMGTIVSKTTVTCQGNKLINHVSLSADEEEFANITVTVTKSGKSLIQDMSGTMLGQQIEDQVLCE